MSESAPGMDGVVEFSVILAEDGFRMVARLEFGVVGFGSIFAEDGRKTVQVGKESETVTAVGWCGEFNGGKSNKFSGQCEGTPGIYKLFPDFGDAGAIRKKLSAREAQMGDVSGPDKIVCQRALVEQHAVDITPVQG